MATNPERYIPNYLPFDYDDAYVLSTRETLIEAVVLAVETFDKGWSAKATKPKLYTGQAGQAVALLRLYLQAPFVGLPTVVIRRLPGLINNILHPCFSDSWNALASAASGDQESRNRVLSFGHCGTMDSPVGPAVLEITRQILFGGSDEGDNRKFHLSLAVLDAGYAACFEADYEEARAGDMAELLYGAAGYLHALLGLRELVSRDFVPDAGLLKARDQRLGKLVSDTNVQALIEQIVRSGINGARLFQEKLGTGVDGPPLMWRGLHQKYYLGGIHGIAGVLTMLLQCPREMIDKYLHSHLLPSIDWIISLMHAGNTAISYTPGHKLHYSYCQFCHGAPGTAILLCTLRAMVPEAMEIDPSSGRTREGALRESLDFIWKEGLLKKGLGICHGVTGNAVPLLFQGLFDLQNGLEQSESLGKALAMLNFSTALPPLNMPLSDEMRLAIRFLPKNLPDHPYSLFEGLAGAVCVWADALVLLNGHSGGEPIIGFPLVGGIGVRLPL